MLLQIVSILTANCKQDLFKYILRFNSADLLKYALSWRLVIRLLS
jgi:hypothetical protein